MGKEKNCNSGQVTAFPKNPNEFSADGKIFLRKIRSCVCSEKLGDRYLLECGIHQRGRHTYEYVRGNGFIDKQLSCRRLWLSGSAEGTVLRAADDFDSKLKKILSGGEYVRTDAPGTGLAVYYRFNPISGYRFLTVAETGRSGIRYSYYDSRSLEEMLHEVQFSTLNYTADEEKKERHRYLFFSDGRSITDNPFYKSAVERGDENMLLKVKAYYRIADPDDCKKLSKLLGARVLPSLPEEFDRYYYVDSDSVGAKDTSLLTRSGYRILHRPYFAMMKSTHKIISLNPHTRQGVDAGPADAGTISFRDYLALFGGDGPTDDTDEVNNGNGTE